MAWTRISGIALLAAALAGAVFTRPATADVTVYSDVTSSGGFGYINGGGTNISALGADYTNLVADDIQAAAGSGGLPITGVTFSFANFNSTAVSAQVELRFYAADGAASVPGTLLGTINVSALTVASNSVVLFTEATSPATPFFNIPANGLFWAGLAFDDGGASTATLAQLNNLGQGLFDPPTIGSSTDVFFQSTAASDFTTSNPTGSLLFFGGSPVANFGWAFTTPPVPEPASLSLLAGAGVGLLLGRRNKPGR